MFTLVLHTNFSLEMTELKEDNTRRIYSNKIGPKVNRTNRTPIARLGSVIEHNRTSFLLWVGLSNRSNKNAIELNPNRFCSGCISWYWVNHAGEIIIDLYWMVLIEKRQNIKPREDEGDREGILIFRIGIKLPRALHGCFVELSHD